MTPKMIRVEEIRRDMRVYFARPIGAIGPVKIGVSRNPLQRADELSRFCPVLLEIVVSASGTHHCEKQLHRHFAAERLHHEWYEASPRLVEFMRRLTAGEPIEAIVPSIEPQRRSVYYRWPRMGEALA